MGKNKYWDANAEKILHITSTEEQTRNQWEGHVVMRNPAGRYVSSIAGRKVVRDL